MSVVPRRKVLVLLLIPLVYVALGGSFYYLAAIGALDRAPFPSELVSSSEYPVELDRVEYRLSLARDFLDSRLVRDDGHVFLAYYLHDAVEEDEGRFANDSRLREDYLELSVDVVVPDAPSGFVVEDTSSEAMSYYLLWTARSGDREAFDRALAYVEDVMVHPEFGYVQWRVGSDGLIREGGENFASDADVRVIRALLIAERRWGDSRYTRAIDERAVALEEYAINDWGMLAPYGGVFGGERFTSQETWISYADFQIFAILAERRGEPWESVLRNMRVVALSAQTEQSFFNSVLLPDGTYSNYLDGDVFSINTLWIMERSAQSDDRSLNRAARRSLDFYAIRFEQDTELFGRYSEQGDSLDARAQSPWVYAIVGRAAMHLDDLALANEMIRALMEMQDVDPQSPLYGSFPEGRGERVRAEQFALHESILTFQEYLVYIEGKRMRGELDYLEEVGEYVPPARRVFGAARGLLD